MLDLKAIGEALLFAGMAVVGWFVRLLWDADKELREDLARLRQEISATYVRRDDLSEWKHEVLQVLRRIEEKLDGKADK